MIAERDFSLDEFVRKLKKPEIGAIVTFLGVVRCAADGEQVSGMNIEMNEKKAEKVLEQLKREAIAKFDVEAVEIVHRKDLLAVGDSIVAILVGAGHRKEAFRACEYIIDLLRISDAIRLQELET
jgi:molybdopterin synthase catalytic subunit